MNSVEKLLLVRNRKREVAFDSLREVKRLLFLKGRGYADEEDLQRAKEVSSHAFKEWKVLEGRLKDVLSA